MGPKEEPFEPKEGPSGPSPGPERKFLHGVLAGVLVGLGIVLILPDDTYGTSQTWSLFQAAGIGEQALGLVLLMAGLLSLTVFFKSFPRKWVPLNVMFLAGVHMTLALVFFLGNRAGGAIVPYTALTLLAFNSVFQQAVESRR